MYFAGRWVPISLVNTIFILWLIAVAMVIGWVFVLGRRRPPTKTETKPPPAAHRGKRRRGGRR